MEIGIDNEAFNVVIKPKFTRDSIEILVLRRSYDPNNLICHYALRVVKRIMLLMRSICSDWDLSQLTRFHTNVIVIFLKNKF